MSTRIPTSMSSTKYIIIGAILVSVLVYFLLKMDKKVYGNNIVVTHKVENVNPVGSGIYADPGEKERREWIKYREELARPKGIYGDPNLPPPELSAKYMSVEEASGIDRQYENQFRSVPIQDMHPVLAYQYMHDKAINPANLGDPIRIPDVAGPVGMYGGVNNFVDSLTISRGSVPVPMGALKMTSEKYNKDMFRFNPLANGTIATALPVNPAALRSESFGPLGKPIIPPGELPYQQHPTSQDFLRPYGPNIPVSNVPFFGSVNAYAPFPEIVTPWEKAGILTSLGLKEELLNLYRRPIAPLQDLWEYQVQDKNGFVIKLENRYLENGDIIRHIVGKPGEWKTHIFVQNKYIWV